MASTYIHPSAIVESADIGNGTKVWAFVHILPAVKIGTNCNIGDNVYIETGAVIGDNVTLKNQVCVWEGVTIEDDVFVGPCVSFTNDLNPRSPRMPEARARYSKKTNWLVRTVVEKGATIGANATIVGGVRLGQYSFVAAGAVATKDVEPFALMVGTPAKKVGYVCRCGLRIEGSFPAERCDDCGTTADFFRQTLQLDGYR